MDEFSDYRAINAGMQSYEGLRNAFAPKEVPSAELHARTFYPLASHRTQVIQASRYVEALRWLRNNEEYKRNMSLQKELSA